MQNYQNNKKKKNPICFGSPIGYAVMITQKRYECEL